MAAGDSSVSICNLALIAIGEDPITSLNDARKAAILCQALYDPTRREVLEMQPWKFAKKQAQLAASTTAPLFTYDNAFPLPADFIRMYDEPEEDNPEYEIMGSMMYSNDDSPFDMLYIFDNQDPTMFSPLFVQTLAMALGAKLAQPITQSIDKENEMAGKFQNYLDSAALVNSQQESARELDDDVLLRSRF
jgi:hypothetical protein